MTTYIFNGRSNGNQYSLMLSRMNLSDEVNLENIKNELVAKHLSQVIIVDGVLDTQFPFVDMLYEIDKERDMDDPKEIDIILSCGFGPSNEAEQYVTNLVYNLNYFGYRVASITASQAQRKLNDYFQTLITRQIVKGSERWIAEFGHMKGKNDDDKPLRLEPESHTEYVKKDLLFFLRQKDPSFATLQLSVTKKRLKNGNEIDIKVYTNNPQITEKLISDEYTNNIFRSSEWARVEGYNMNHTVKIFPLQRYVEELNISRAAAARRIQNREIEEAKISRVLGAIEIAGPAPVSRLDDDDDDDDDDDPEEYKEGKLVIRAFNIADDDDTARSKTLIMLRALTKKAREIVFRYYPASRFPTENFSVEAYFSRGEYGRKNDDPNFYLELVPKDGKQIPFIVGATDATPGFKKNMRILANHLQKLVNFMVRPTQTQRDKYHHHTREGHVTDIYISVPYGKVVRITKDRLENEKLTDIFAQLMNFTYTPSGPVLNGSLVSLQTMNAPPPTAKNTNPRLSGPYEGKLYTEIMKQKLYRLIRAKDPNFDVDNLRVKYLSPRIDRLRYGDGTVTNITNIKVEIYTDNPEINREWVQEKIIEIKREIDRHIKAPGVANLAPIDIRLASEKPKPSVRSSKKSEGEPSRAGSAARASAVAANTTTPAPRPAPAPAPSPVPVRIPVAYNPTQVYNVDDDDDDMDEEKPDDYEDDDEDDDEFILYSFYDSRDDLDEREGRNEYDDDEPHHIEAIEVAIVDEVKSILRDHYPEGRRPLENFKIECEVEHAPADSDVNFVFTLKILNKHDHVSFIDKVPLMRRYVVRLAKKFKKLLEFTEEGNDRGDPRECRMTELVISAHGREITITEGDLRNRDLVDMFTDIYNDRDHYGIFDD